MSCWTGARDAGLEVEQTAEQEFIVPRQARPEDQKEERIDSGCGNSWDRCSNCEFSLEL